MISICYYVSDHGYGHASRSIAVIRRILNSCDFDEIKIYVKTHYPFNFVRRSLSKKNIKVIKTKNDFGVVFKENSVEVDKDKTSNMLNEWLDSWTSYIQKEKEFYKSHEIDLILSDITPQPLIAAEEMGIPSIIISNFTWYYIFFNLFGKIETTERIKEAYRCAGIGLVLPFNEKMDYIENKKEISLVTREITVDRSSLRKKHGISDDESLVYIGIGKSFAPSFLNNLKEINNSNVKYLFSSDIRLSFRNMVKIPINETESQNYLAMCDLIVSKMGYSTVSEAIRAKLPMVLFKRRGWKEDELIGIEIEEMGIGRIISKKSLFKGDWMYELEGVENYTNKYETLNNRFKKDGTLEILSYITEMIS